MTDKQKIGILAIPLILYITVGIFFQWYTCLHWNQQVGRDGISPDIPCAGIPWTPIIVLGWPLIGTFGLIHGQTWEGFVTLGLLVLIVVSIFIVVRKVSRNA